MVMVHKIFNDIILVSKMLGRNYIADDTDDDDTGGQRSEQRILSWIIGIRYIEGLILSAVHNGGLSAHNALVSGGRIGA